MNTTINTLNLELPNSKVTWALQFPVDTKVTSLEQSTKTPDRRQAVRWTQLCPSPTRSAARNDWGSHHAHQAPTNIKPSLSKEQGLDKSQHIARDQDSIEMATYGRRHYPVKGSDSSGTPQMTPETGPSAAQTPDGQRTPLPRYTLGPCGADPPAYAESEPSGLAV